MGARNGTARLFSTHVWTSAHVQTRGPDWRVQQACENKRVSSCHQWHRLMGSLFVNVNERERAWPRLTLCELIDKCELVITVADAVPPCTTSHVPGATYSCATSISCIAWRDRYNRCELVQALLIRTFHSYSFINMVRHIASFMYGPHSVSRRHDKQFSLTKFGSTMFFISKRSFHIS